MLWESVRLAVTAIFRNTMRSFLTVLGIVIGVAAVIAMVTVGQGSSDQVAADVESLGTNVLMVMPGSSAHGPGSGFSAPPLDMDDSEAITEELSFVKAAAPTASRSITVVFGNDNHRTQVTGTDNSYLTGAEWPVVLGREFYPAEINSGKLVCVIGETIRQTFFGNTSPLGEKLRLKNVTCEVIGVLEAKGASSFGADQDDLVLVPIKAFHHRIAGNSDVHLVFVAVKDGTSMDKAVRDVEELMRDIRRIGVNEDDDFEVMSMEQIAGILTGITNVLAGMLSAVAAVSLLVGGIGIMNIMLVSVTERTREIGIRLAVGAQARQVLLQFLVEAIVLSLLGGVIGILLGLVLAAVASRMMGIGFAPDPLIVLMAFAFSAAVGVVFGYFPARAAARLDPIEALRHQ